MHHEYGRLTLATAGLLLLFVLTTVIFTTRIIRISDEDWLSRDKERYLLFIITYFYIGVARNWSWELVNLGGGPNWARRSENRDRRPSARWAF